MSKRDNGGPAFPAESVSNGDGGRRPQHYSGMSMRDYFAAKAMQGLLAGNAFDYDAIDDEATLAYGIANAMLKARQA